MAVAAQFGYAFSLGLLRVRIMAGLALHSLLAMEAGLPFLGRSLVAGSAEFGVGPDRHQIARMA
jgi:hypothetical protein